MKFENLYSDNNLLICDSECLTDYWSFIFKRTGQTLAPKVKAQIESYSQIRKTNDTYIFECWTDEDAFTFKHFYDNVIKPNKSVLFFYNSEYDTAVTNTLLNLVVNKSSNILLQLRKLSDYIIQYRIDFKLFRKIYWKNFFQDKRGYIIEDELFKFFDKPAYRNFYKDFKDCMIDQMSNIYDFDTRKKVKVVQVNDIMKIANYGMNKATKSESASFISLKKLQLVHLGENQKFDFNKYKSMNEVIEDGKYQTFIDYSVNDVVSLEKMFYLYAEKDIKNRYYALKVVIDTGLKDLTYNADLLFTETNTALISAICSLDHKQTEFDINYSDYIKTDIPEFNEYVEFVNNNKSTTNDKTLKEKYNTKTGHDVPEFEINGTVVKSGLGGCHGAISNYKNNLGNLFQLDYASQYPSIILEYKELFRNVMNVDLYEQVYNLRIKYKSLKKDAKKSGDVEKAEEYDNIQNGLKLILNSLYGLLNSNYDIPMANKVLGRFICLKGQSLLYNLCTENKEIKAPNINTDGVYMELNSIEEGLDIAKQDYINNKKGYFKLDVDPVKWVIQNDVNNYILATSNSLKVKGGSFNLGFKQKFNSNSNLDVNTHNAIKLLKNEKIEVSKIYFKGMSNIDCDKAYYLTNSDYGINPITKHKKPLKLSIEGNDIFVTTDVTNADIEKYVEYAEITKGMIENFDTKVKQTKYYEHYLTNDTAENNKEYTSNINRIKKLLDCDIKAIGYSGYKGNTKAYTFLDGSQSKPLINYTKTEIKNSSDSKAVAVSSKDKLIIVDIDIFDKNTGTCKNGYPKELVKQMNEIPTYKTWNSNTKDYGNCKLIFKNDINKILDVNKDLKGFVEILDNAVVWSMNDHNLSSIYYDNNMPAIPISDYEDLFKNYIEIKHDDADKYIKQKEEKKEKGVIIDTNSSDIIVNTMLDQLKNEKIDLYNVVKEENGIHFHTACPYCNVTNTTHYLNNKGKIDAYINIVEDGTGYALNVFNLSTSCKNDNSHQAYYKGLNKKFKDSLPSSEIINNNKLFMELKAYVDIDKIYDETFFKKDTVKIVGTGGGKTFQTACRLIRNLLNGVFTIVTTKQNSNIQDFERTVKKAIKLALTGSTKRIDDFLESEDGFKELFIHKLTNVNPINIKKMDLLKGVVTNHKYFYNNGHLAQYNNNIILLRKHLESKPTEIIIDEYESFKENGVLTLDLNCFLEYDKDVDTDLEIWSKSNSCFFPCKKKLFKTDMAFENAQIDTLQEMSENEGIYTYKLNKNGNKNLRSEFYEYCEPVGPIQYDSGRRFPQKIHKNSNISYVICDKIQQYKLKTNITETGLKNNFKDLLFKNEYIAMVTRVIKVSTTFTENFNVNLWGDELGDMVAFNDYFKKLSPDEFVQLKNKIYKSTKCGVSCDMYIEYLAINVKSIMDSFKCNKYYLTANTIKSHTLQIDTELAYQSSKSIENIDVAIMDKEKKNDITILENIDLLVDADFKTLAFTSLKNPITNIINQKINIKTDHVVIKASINSGDKSVNVDTRQCEDIDDNLLKTTTLAYVNGTESQGRNYSNSELLIINSNLNINVKGRLSINQDGEIVIKTLQEASMEKLKQAIGRIFRGTQKYKAMIILGDCKDITQLFSSYGEYSINFNLHKYNKKLDRKSSIRKAFSDIIEYYGSKFAELNHPESRDQREVEFFNGDLRKTNKRPSKVDQEEVYNYYLSMVQKYYEENKKKPKDKELIDDIRKKFLISERSFKTIKKKYKEGWK